jgi:hypothetical protein
MVRNSNPVASHAQAKLALFRIKICMKQEFISPKTGGLDHHVALIIDILPNRKI